METWSQLSLCAEVTASRLERHEVEGAAPLYSPAAKENRLAQQQPWPGYGAGLQEVLELIRHAREGYRYEPRCSFQASKPPWSLVVHLQLRDTFPVVQGSSCAQQV